MTSPAPEASSATAAHGSNLVIPFGSARPSRPKVKPDKSLRRATWAKALADGGWTVVHTDPATGSWLVVHAPSRIAPDATGTWTAESIVNENGGSWTKWTKRSDVVLARTVEIRHLVGDVDIVRPTYVVGGWRATGPLRRQVEMSEEDSLNLPRVQAALGGGFPITDKHAAAALRDSLAKTAHDEIESRVTYGATGWVKQPTGWIFVAPQGSPHATGVATDLRVDVTVGASAEEGTGWPTVPVGNRPRIRSAFESFGGFVRIAPTRPDYIVALLGAAFVPLVGLSRRTTVLIDGKPGSAKSLSLSATMAFLSTVGCDGQTVPAYMPNTSRVGAGLVMGWHRHLPALFDDYRMQKGKTGNTNERMQEAMTAIAQAAYGAAAEAKSTVEGVRRGTTISSASAIVAGELRPSDQATMQRLMPVRVDKGDIDAKRGGGYDQFKELYASTGLAREAYGLVLAWLAQRLDGEWRTLGAMAADWSAERSSQMSIFGDERAGEATATLAVGMKVLVDALVHYGCRDLLPLTDEQISAALATLCAGAGAAHEEASAAQAVIDHLRDMVAASTGYVLDHTGAAPHRLQAAALGWEVRSPSAFEDVVHGPGAVKIGQLSDDRQYILVTNAALAHAKDAAGYGGHSASQLFGLLEEFAVPGTVPGAKVKSGFGIGSRDNRPRGTLLPANLILDVVPDDAAEPVQDDKPTAY